MSEKIILSYTKLPNPNNKQLERDGDYYKVRLGAFNIFNSKKEFYVLGDVEKILTQPDSPLWRKIKNGCLTGEADHPIVTGMTLQEIIARNARIDRAREAFTIRDIILTKTNETCKNMDVYGSVVLVEAWIRPSGPFGDYLKQDLDDPDKNVCFSIRSMSSDEIVKGVTIKHTKYIFTWDWVQEPGVKLTNKFDALAGNILNCESLDISLELKDIENLLTSKEEENKKLKDAGINNESNDDLINQLNYINNRYYKPSSLKNIILDWNK